MPFDKDDIDIVLYNGNNCDGFASAFAIWYYYKCKHGLNRANIIQYKKCFFTNEKIDESDIEFITNKNVLMCNFYLRYKCTLELIQNAKSFLLIDHHTSAKTDLIKLNDKYKILNDTLSNCGLVWSYFYPNIEMPIYFQYIQDYFLWTNKFNESKNFITYLNQQFFNFDFYESLLDNNVLNNAISIGKNWINYQNIIVQNIIATSRFIIHKIDGKFKIALYINSPILRYELGFYSLSYYPFCDFSCVWNYYLTEDKTCYSLRSIDDKTDVSLIAKKYKGGGNINSAGCQLDEVNGILPLDTVDDYNLLDHLTKNNFNFNDLLPDHYYADKKIIEFLKNKLKYY